MSWVYEGVNIQFIVYEDAYLCDEYVIDVDNSIKIGVSIKVS